MTDEEFYDCTPRQLRALLRRREIELERSEYMIAQLTAVVKNYSFREIETPAKPRDFMLSQQPEKQRKSIRPSDTERIRTEANFRAFFKAYEDTGRK